MTNIIAVVTAISACLMMACPRGQKMACDLEQSTSLLQSFVTTQDFADSAVGSHLDDSDGSREVADVAGPFDDILGGVLNTAIDGLLKGNELDKAATKLSNLTESIADICVNATDRLNNLSRSVNCTDKVSEFKATADEVNDSWSGISQEIQSKLGELKIVLGVIQHAKGMEDIYSTLADILDTVPSLCDNVSVVLHNASMIDSRNCGNLTTIFNDTSSTVSDALGKLENMSADNLTSDLDSKMAATIDKVWKKLEVHKLVSNLGSLPVFLQTVVNASAGIVACLSGNASTNQTSM
eukprot:TRINITY_DN5852_c0_g1_i1.p1 TRINITY_DN5852_c0_g1~~TRINITY_DN5852_c0_g1_i1.p1  ORF type:complete len:320 (-),score=53.34 TRINITY_DN5852_c0_g1_i1:411-1298(-)